MAITSTPRKLNVLSICKTSLNTQLYFSNHPLKSLLGKAIRPQTYMLYVGEKKINAYDWQQFRTPGSIKLWRICFSPSWERVNARWRKHCGALLLPFRTLGSRALQAGPRVPHCRGCSGRGPSRAPCFGCLLTSSLGTIRISQNLKGSFSPLLKFAACHEPNRLFQWLWLRRWDGGGRGQQ